MINKKIKGSHITNLTDARYFAAWGAEWLGFCVDTLSNNYMLPEEIIEIKDWIDGCKITLEFGIQDFNEINALVEKIKPQAIEIPIQSYHKDFESLDTEIILRIDSIDSMSSILINPNIYFLIAFSELQLTWDKIKVNTELLNLLKSLAVQVNLIVDLDFSKNNIKEIVEKIPFYAINLKGGEEEKVGLKSFDELDEILEVLED